MLYLALLADSHDLRDRFPGSEWLLYAQQLFSQAFSPNDVLLLSEWMVPEEGTRWRLLESVRRTGARVVYVGSKAKEDDEVKRRLVGLGIYDFVFIGDELNLRDVDALVHRPRALEDVEAFAPRQAVVSLPPPPALVDVFEAHDSGLLGRATAHLAWRKGKKSDEESLHSPDVPKRRTRVQWTTVAPVRVAIAGSPGVGKTFLAWNLAAALQAVDLSTAVIESDEHPLVRWSQRDALFVTSKEPSRGYRVHLHATGRVEARPEVLLVMVHPDPFAIEDAKKQWGERPDVWVVNRYAADAPLPELPDAIRLPYELRQTGAIRMSLPLSQTQPALRATLSPIVERVRSLFLEHVEAQGVSDDVVAAGTTP